MKLLELAEIKGLAFRSLMIDVLCLFVNPMFCICLVCDSVYSFVLYFNELGCSML